MLVRLSESMHRVTVIQTFLCHISNECVYVWMKTTMFGLVYTKNCNGTAIRIVPKPRRSASPRKQSCLFVAVIFAKSSSCQRQLLWHVARYAEVTESLRSLRIQTCLSFQTAECGVRRCNNDSAKSTMVRTWSLSILNVHEFVSFQVIRSSPILAGLSGTRAATRLHAVAKRLCTTKLRNEKRT